MFIVLIALDGHLIGVLHGNLKDYHFWPVAISFCKVKVKPEDAKWVQDYMAVRSLLPVALHFTFIPQEYILTTAIMTS